MLLLGEVKMKTRVSVLAFVSLMMSLVQPVWSMEDAPPQDTPPNRVQGGKAPSREDNGRVNQDPRCEWDWKSEWLWQWSDYQSQLIPLAFDPYPPPTPTPTTHSRNTPIVKNTHQGFSEEKKDMTLTEKDKCLLNEVYKTLGCSEILNEEVLSQELRKIN